MCRTLSLVPVILGLVIPAHGEPLEARQRRFLFRYTVGLKAGDDRPVRLWVPLWTDSPHQQLHRLRIESSGSVQLAHDRRYGNRLVYVTGKAQNGVLVQVEMEVTRQEVRAPVGPGGIRLEMPGANVRPEPLDENQRRLFLSARRLVPVGGPAIRLLRDVPMEQDRLRLAYLLYRRVLDHMVYRKAGTGWGRGSVEWACQAGYGNCTDFHSLFMAMARYYDIPTKFVIGFSLPQKRGRGQIQGYHCWAYFYVDGIGWIPVDISEADKHPELAAYYFGNLTEHRLALSTGRDVPLDPPAAVGELNYFIYPHAERHDQVVPREELWWRVEYEDVER